VKCFFICWFDFVCFYVACEEGVVEMIGDYLKPLYNGEFNPDEDYDFVDDE
jgi:hypothetical protein